MVAARNISMGAAGFRDTLKANSDTTQFVNDLNNIYSIGTGNTGYGGTSFPLITEGNQIKRETVLGWKAAINELSTHQNSTVSFLNNSDILTTYFTDLKDNELPTVTSNKLNVDMSNVSITNYGSSVRTTSWNTQIVHEFTLTWTTTDEARYFFNTGGQIRLSASRSGGSTNTQNSNWTALLSNAGSIIFDQSDYYGLSASTTYTTINLVSGTGAYSTNNWTIQAYYEGSAGSNGANGRILRFRSIFDDSHTAIGAGPDTIDGTLTSSIDQRISTGVFSATAPIYSSITGIDSSN